MWILIVIAIVLGVALGVIRRRPISRDSFARVVLSQVATVTAGAVLAIAYVQQSAFPDRHSAGFGTPFHLLALFVTAANATVIILEIIKKAKSRGGEPPTTAL